MLNSTRGSMVAGDCRSQRAPGRVPGGAVPAAPTAMKPPLPTAPCICRIPRVPFPQAGRGRVKQGTSRTTGLMEE